MFLNSDAAFQHFYKVLVSYNLRVVSIGKFNHDRHRLVQVEDKVFDDRKYFYALFKHEGLHSFNYLAKDFVGKYPNFAGHGQSINVEFLDYACRFDSIIAFIDKFGHIYIIRAKELRKFVYDNGLIRTQDRENAYEELHGNQVLSILKNEKTAIFPLKILVRYYPE